ncbi:hypothetical protein ACFXPS_04915 [Nocardia sp. NPDC059091]|uniref:hypothetical protein n=1 Tax=unclassified Nocardia TaxID=2637762 RepID=UPI003696147D
MDPRRVVEPDLLQERREGVWGRPCIQAGRRLDAVPVGPGSGLLYRQEEPGRGATPRQVLSLTAAGHAELLRRLREPAEVEITDRNSFLVLLAFLGRLPDPADQARVLLRRLHFMDGPAGYFYADGKPLRAADMTDRFRKGMLTLAAATSRADRAWLESTIADLVPDRGSTGPAW